MKRYSFLIVCFAFALFSCNASNSIDSEANRYSDRSFWAFFPDEYVFDVDVFFVAPTILLGNDSILNMDIDDTILRNNFIGSINMQKEIYDNNANFYAPFYRQASIYCYEIRGDGDVSQNERINYAFELAYKDICEAFERYLEESGERPFVLAGFSQGSEMLLRLLIDKFHSSNLRNRLIAAYLIGWRLEDEVLNKYEHIKIAERELDTGVIISFCTEDIDLDYSIIVPQRTNSINPLIWKRDTTQADRSKNKGAVFKDYDGRIINEIPNLTGAYICQKRGTLKAIDVNSIDYPPVLSLFSEGDYHIYDYQFFFRNLQENVNKRINSFKLAK